MLKGGKAYMIILLLLFGVLIFVESMKPKPFTWETTLSKNDRIPFGSYLLYHHLDVLFPLNEVKTASKPLLKQYPNDGVHYNYIIFDQDFQPDTLEVKFMLERVSNGAHFFIAANSFSSFLCNELDLTSDTNAFTTANPELELLLGIPLGDTITCMFENPKLNHRIWYDFDRAVQPVSFSSMNSETTTILGTDDRDKPNFIKVGHGKGAFFLHTMPRIFTNYYIAHPDNHKYVFRALSYLPQADTYWDEYYKQDHAQPNTVNSNSPLRFILSNPELKYGLWVIIGATLLIMLFRAKRKQRVIPVQVPLENTTLKFVDVISRLYYQRSNHKNIAEKKILYFLEFIRSNFQVSTHQFDDEFLNKIAIRSGIEQDNIKHLFRYIDYLSMQDKVREGQLLELNKKIEEFLRTSKR